MFTFLKSSPEETPGFSVSPEEAEVLRGELRGSSQGRLDPGQTRQPWGAEAWSPPEGPGPLTRLLQTIAPEKSPYEWTPEESLERALGLGMGATGAIRTAKSFEPNAFLHRTVNAKELPSLLRNFQSGKAVEVATSSLLPDLRTIFKPNDPIGLIFNVNSPSSLGPVGYRDFWSWSNPKGAAARAEFNLANILDFQQGKLSGEKWGKYYQALMKMQGMGEKIPAKTSWVYPIGTEPLSGLYQKRLSDFADLLAEPSQVPFHHLIDEWIYKARDPRELAGVRINRPSYARDWTKDPDLIEPSIRKAADDVVLGQARDFANQMRVPIFEFEPQRTAAQAHAGLKNYLEGPPSRRGGWRYENPSADYPFGRVTPVSDF